VTLRVLSLFAGIGGFDLGLERTGGFKTVAFCEQDEKAQQVLAKHWHGVPIYDDVRTLTGERLAADGIAVDAIVGGFPCQDISTAGRGAGIEGKRSGLWADYARLIGEIRPLYVIVENVSALLGRGMDRVLGDLATLGYDAWWDCIPASAIGAPHRRDRIWIVAYPASERCGEAREYKPERRAQRASCGRPALSNPSSLGLEEPRRMGNASGPATGEGWEADHAFDGRWWKVEPEVGRVANGVPGRVDRLKQLGNAVVPQIPELIGRAILASLAEQKDAA
jgi:DNA (cytosine-5)-methyltransferase 1